MLTRKKKTRQKRKRIGQVSKQFYFSRCYSGPLMIQFTAGGCLRFSQTRSHSSSFSACIVGSLVSFNVKAKDNWTQGISRKNHLIKEEEAMTFYFSCHSVLPAGRMS